ncbi:MAG: DUF4259 domain-containing protein [Lysobacter sp.]|nr:DUF4259 domain-containing protein [Lysobacter sp.]
MRFVIAALLLLGLTSPTHAGTWGLGQFDNDHSRDTASDWAQSGNVDSVRAALSSALSAEYLESPDAVDALVAAEVVAAALDQPSDKLPADLAAWIKRLPSDRLRSLAPQARAAVARVRSPETSELYELWAEAELEAWLSHVDALSKRLESSMHHQAP